jgi:hypothetical protein
MPTQQATAIDATHAIPNPAKWRVVLGRDEYVHTTRGGMSSTEESPLSRT